ncbi:hypothetical protein ACHAW6_011406 [Cyclotella cf. meneghiniana]
MKQSAMAYSSNHDGASNLKERVRKPTRHKGNGFGEFPIQMSTPEITTPRVTNKRNEPQSRIRFADDTKPPQSSGQRKQVLVLGPSSDIQTPTTSPLQANSLDFSMIATPGGPQLARTIDHNYSTPSEPASTSTVSSALWPAGTPFTNLLRGVVSSTPNVNPRRIFSATPYTAARETLYQQDETESINNLDRNGNEYNALTFARAAPLSGYLRKLGKNIPTFKRRFFVLKPSTHLYYFMSPTDVEPRGCIDLDLVRENGERGGCEVREIGVLPDGTFRFELLFEDDDFDEEPGHTDNDASDTNHHTSPHSRKREFQKQSIVLEARTEEIGREWMAKLQTERLSTARDEIEFLKETLVEVKATSSRWERIAEEEQARANEAEKLRETATLEAKYWEEKFNDLNKAVGLLSDLVTNDEKSDDVFSSDSLAQSIEGLDLNGTHFLRVSKAFKTIHDNHIAASEEAEDERKRADDLENRLKESESNLSKAEAELCQVWEDNCAIQKELKKSKREKKVLVREVRAQRAKASDDSQKNVLSTKQESSCASTEQSHTQKQGSKCDDSESTSLLPAIKMNSDQQRLVIELEEHVMSGLRLSEQFLTLNGIEPSIVGDDLDSFVEPSHSPPVRNPAHHPLHESGVPAKLCSLLDDDYNDESSNDEEDSTTDANQSAKQSGELETQNLDSQRNREATPSHSTHDIGNNSDASIHKSSIQYIAEAQAPEDPFAYYKDLLGQKRVSQNLNDRFREVLSPTPNNTEKVNTQSEQHSVDPARPFVITETGHATSKLVCPLRDVGETPSSYPPGSTLGEDNEVYHITFYSAKIGLQFQKVPAENAPVGLLNDAMTADLGANRTALDLERIATISQQSQNISNSKKAALECPPVRPVDMVLVCGFVGFDESTGNSRPRIGARLVAFDGIPVEVGKWTFESIKKSIQARGRPLTLSFRNDFLTPKQREILTKAVNDVNGYDEPNPEKQNSATIFRGSDREAATEKKNAILSKSSSISSNSNKYYSLSEAGSSITSAVAPLMSNLMTGFSAGTKKREEFTPDYLRRPSSSLDEMKHHHDFQSGLL